MLSRAQRCSVARLGEHRRERFGVGVSEVAGERRGPCDGGRDARLQPQLARGRDAAMACGQLADPQGARRRGEPGVTTHRHRGGPGVCRLPREPETHPLDALATLDGRERDALRLEHRPLFDVKLQIHGQAAPARPAPWCPGEVDVVFGQDFTQRSSP